MGTPRFVYKNLRAEDGTPGPRASKPHPPKERVFMEAAFVLVANVGLCTLAFTPVATLVPTS